MMITEADFQQVTTEALRDLAPEHRFKPVEMGFSVRWAAPEVVIQVDYDANRSHELSVLLSEPGQTDPAFEVADILRVTVCPESEVASVELVQSGELDVLGKFLRRMVTLLLEYAQPFLDGDHRAFADARRVRSERAKEFTDRVRSAHAIREANAAWSEGDLARVYDLLDPIVDLLGAART